MLRDGQVEEAGPARALISAPQGDYGRALVAATPRLSDPPPALPEIGEPLLEARDISVSFPRPGLRKGRIAAVREASLAIASGEALALVGGSGSGKSTLGRAIARLGPIDSGTVDWRGEPGTPGVAPALVNAIYDATGDRIRSLPVSNFDFNYRFPPENA